jgi:kynurenine formamidase
MLIDLTHPLQAGQPCFPGDPPLVIEPHCSLAAGDVYNLTRLSMGTHQGTHLDAMSHFVEGGRTVDAMPLEWFFGPARLLRLPKQRGETLEVADFQAHEAVLLPGARILFETGWHRHHGTDDFYSGYPSMTQEAAHYLASRKLRLIGMDTPTPGKDFYEIHHILLAPAVEMVIVEALANLDKLPDDREFLFMGFPLRLAGRDGSPIRAVADVPEL